MSVGQGLNVGWLPDIATCLRLRKRQTNKTADEFITVDIHPQRRPGRVNVTRLCKSTGLQLLTGRRRRWSTSPGQRPRESTQCCSADERKAGGDGAGEGEESGFSAFATRSRRVRQSRGPSQNKR